MASPTRKKKTRLTDIDPDEVSVVPMGKNNRKFLLTKEKTMDELLKKILNKELEGGEDLETLMKEGKMTADEQKTLKAAARLLNSIGGKVSENVMQELRKLAGMGEKKKPEQKEKTKKELLEDLRKEGYKIEEPKEPEVKVDSETKKLLDDIRKEYDTKFEDIKKENDILRDNLKKERDQRVTREFEEKAETFGYKGDEAKEVATLLKSASDTMEKEQYEKLEQRLKSQAAQNKVAHLFKEAGSSQGGTGGSSELDAKVEAKKEELRKENPKWTDAKLESEVFDRNPDLYNEYLDSHPAQGGR